MDLLAEVAAQQQRSELSRTHSQEDLVAAEQLDSLRTSAQNINNSSSNNNSAGASNVSGKRHQITPAEKDILLRYFVQDLAPKRRDREQVARELNEMILANPEKYPKMASGQTALWTERRVQIFFQNQRASIKKRQERPSGHLWGGVNGGSGSGENTTASDTIQESQLSKDQQSQKRPKLEGNTQPGLLPSPLTPSQMQEASSPTTTVQVSDSTKPNTVPAHTSAPKFETDAAPIPVSASNTNGAPKASAGPKIIIPRIPQPGPQSATSNNLRPIATALPSVISAVGAPTQQKQPHYQSTYAHTLAPLRPQPAKPKAMIIPDGVASAVNQSLKRDRSKPSPILPRPPNLPSVMTLPPKIITSAMPNNQPNSAKNTTGTPIGFMPMPYFVPARTPHGTVAPGLMPMSSQHPVSAQPMHQQPVFLMMSPSGNVVPFVYPHVHAQQQQQQLHHMQPTVHASVPASPVMFTRPVHNRPSLSATAPVSSATSPIASKAPSPDNVVEKSGDEESIGSEQESSAELHGDNESAYSASTSSLPSVELPFGAAVGDIVNRDLTAQEEDPSHQDANSGSSP